MSPMYEREEQAFRAAYAVIVEDTPPPPAWDDFRRTREAVSAPVRLAVTRPALLDRRPAGWPHRESNQWQPQYPGGRSL